MKPLDRRFRNTLAFLEQVSPPPARILDLGVDNELARKMRERGYIVRNTPEVDLDYFPEHARGADVDIVTAFEILEHLFNPFAVLAAIEAPCLVATVPLRLWFAPAYRNARDPYDQHFHEFERWQFDRLLEKTGWEVVRTESWKSPGRVLGIRPLLRCFTDRYYVVEARNVRDRLDAPNDT